MKRALILALVHVAIVGVLGAKLLIDRERFPRAWVETAPVDPDLPIRGRYVRLRLLAPHDGEVVAYFIPEDVADPSIRPAGETLWVEVTVPRDGPPRPIRLGVRRGDGDIEPLSLR
jgi:uncharacterized membrane-anchored protein